MAEDGEWHTVSKTHAPSTNNTSTKTSTYNRHRRKSKHTPSTKSQKDNKKPATAHKQQRKVETNPFHESAHHDDDASSEEEDGQIDPIDLPVPPYHTTIVVSCPLPDCESPIPFLDTTSLTQHLKQDHKLVFKNFHHMYMALDAYLDRWAKELSQKPVSEYGQLESPDSEGNKVCIFCDIMDLFTNV